MFEQDSDSPSPGDTVVWTHCHVNCGGQCPLQCHVRDGRIVSVECDTTGSSEFGRFQPRACLRGRSIRRWLAGEDRLNYPMRRVPGTARGEGGYERISWDEALDTIAAEFTRIRETYGNEAIFVQGCSGVEQNVFMNSPFFRLFNLCGGTLRRYGNYSNAALNHGALPYTYGGNWAARPFRSIAEGELVVLFGNAPADTRMAGDGAGYDLNVARERRHARVIVIDPRRSDLATNQDVEWIPIMPGTDAALVAGIAHELIAADLVDLDFLHRYCVGYDEGTLPPGAPAGSSYYAYVMGTGYDMVEKTPRWAARVTRVPERRIVELAHQIGEAKPCFICQGYGPQRRTNGDSAARSILLLAQLVGQVGRPHTNSGGREGCSGFELPTLPEGRNPVPGRFPNFLWPEAIDHGDRMTATNAGIKDVPALRSPIKMLVSYGSNLIANQNSDINRTTDILRDERKCEFILQYDVVWCDSCNWADIVLPDLTPQETWTLSSQGENNNSRGVWFGRPVTPAKYERREVYEVCGELAKRLGVYDEYSAGGRTREDWCRVLYEQWAADHPRAPRTWEDGLALGVYKEDMEESGGDAEATGEGGTAGAGVVAGEGGRDASGGGTEAFILDPESHPLPTATGKIQIYSPELAEFARTWELDEGDEILPIPAYAPGVDNVTDGAAGDATGGEFPLVLVGYHTKAHTHSTYANNEFVQAVHRHDAWINPVDAGPRGIASGDTVRVKSANGEIQIVARVTNRIIPGCVAIPQGTWHAADMQGDRVDFGGCTNTLSSRHCTPVAKGVGCHSALIEVVKVEGATGSEAEEAARGEARARTQRQQTAAQRQSRAQSEQPFHSQYGFYFDATRCTGCKTCELACADAHDLPIGVSLRRVHEYEGPVDASETPSPEAWTQDDDGAWTLDGYTYYVSLACNHCAEPACMDVCPVGAISKNERGLVLIDEDACVECGRCAKACPYQAPRVDRSLGRCLKCDGCAERVAAGLRPVCVAACPSRALDSGDLSYLRERHGTGEMFAPLPPAELTAPSLVVRSSRDARPCGDTTGAIVNRSGLG